MKKLILSVIFAAQFFTITTAQNSYPNLPKDSETGLVLYEEVVEVQGINKDSLYNRALNWFYTFYKNPNGVLQEKNQQEGKLFGMPAYKIDKVDEKGIKQKGGIVKYSIYVFLKDGKYKYKIEKIHWDMPSYYGIEKWFDEKSPQKKDFVQYLQQTDTYFTDLILSLKQGMLKKPVVKDETKW